jgi:uncharacterized membrane protein
VEADVPTSLTLNGWKGPRVASLLIGLGMIGASLLTIHHFFAVNFPASIYAGSFCDLSAFFNCSSSAYAPIAQLGGVPLGYFGLMLGALVVLGTLFPSETLERTNLSLATVNAAGVVGVAVYSVAFYGSLCLYCSLYWLLSLTSFGVFWRWGVGRELPGGVRRLARPSLLVLAVFGVALAGGAFGYARFLAAKTEAQTGGEAARVVREYFALPHVAWPSTISPFWPVRSTARFEDAPIQVVEYTDFLCSDCLMAYKQMRILKRDFAGRINIAFQPFPLETKCNRVVDKNKHPGACDAAAIALAAGPERFARIHDEIFDHFQLAKTPAWRSALARRYGVPGATADTAVLGLARRLMETGREYERTSEKFAFGIRSTPTMIVNNRMIIGTLPTAHLRAIFQALVEQREGQAGQRFLENWVQ